MKKRISFQPILYVVLLFAAIIILFQWYMTQNSKRMINRNMVYAADSAGQIADQVDEELNNGLNLIRTYTYFIGESLTEPTITADLLKELKSNTSLFDTLVFTDMNGVNLTSDGSKSDASGRDYYELGKEGQSGITVIFDSAFYDEPMLCFYAPVVYNDEIIGVLRGAYLAEDHLKDMLTTTYFGENASVHLCMPNRQVIACSDTQKHTGDLVDWLVQTENIDNDASLHTKEVFENGGDGTFVCSSESKTDNICVRYLSDNKDFVLVQTFPKSVTQDMTKSENLIGIKLESMMIGLFIIYIITLMVRARREKKKLEHENHDMEYILSGINMLFARFALIDFETGTYMYLEGTNPKVQGIGTSGKYESFAEYLCSTLASDSDRERFAEQIRLDNIVSALDDHRDLRFEHLVKGDDSNEWEHVNIICLERKKGKAVKALFTRQNISEVKNREIKLQNEMSVANRKERQYRIAITSNSLCTYEFDLTGDVIEQDIIRTIRGKSISLIEKAGLQVPCKASEWIERSKQFILDESREYYESHINLAYLQECFDNGEAEMSAEYWELDPNGEPMCIRQSFVMTKDEDTDHIIVLVISREITSQVIAQREQTQALQDALMQAQHANAAKTTFLSNMSHDIRTPMNAIIGFTTIAISHIDNKDQVTDCLAKVLSSSNHLLSLINDILDMSRIESGKVQIKEQNCNISELMHNLVNIIQPQVKAKQLELFIDTFEVKNEDVVTDPLKLTQVFINLLSNAVKYTPARGSLSFRIIQKTTFRHGWGDYVFIVKDNGIGMSQEFLQHVFEPFERESTTTRSGIEGTGLGMAITKNIVEMMNGKISVESELGKGSVFTVELSLKLQDIVNDTEQLDDLKGLRALVVDDDFHVCDSVSKMLKQIGLRSEWTTSGRDAVCRSQVAHSDGDPYHTYIIDWQMPDISGIETAKKIRKTVGDSAPIIILTAYDWTDIEEEAREAGVTGFCAKPLFMSDLKSALIAANNSASKEEKSAAWTLTDFSGKRVLLVEDNELNREIAEVILTEAGFEVETAPDGTDAVNMVEKSEENYYDAILMDVQMPIMNGYEATRTIRNMDRADVKDIPIIAMTANALEEDRENAIKHGMSAHIAKPLDIDVFIETLRQFLIK